jgi:hypothetical protein
LLPAKIKNKMKKIFPILLLAPVVLSSCLKEFSTEEGGNTGAGVIIGNDCRIAKIAYTDSASGAGIGSISAVINSMDEVTDVTMFDSLSLTIDFNAIPVYFNDTVYIDPEQYFVRETVSKRIKKFHGLIDPTVSGSPTFETNYVYDGSGRLTQKLSSYSLVPGINFQEVTYTYTGSNLTGMVYTDAFTGNKIKDATVSYYNTIAPKNFMYIFPDEENYAEFNQFFNFGSRPVNAVQNIKVRYYDPGNVLTDSSVSTFKGYIMSRDNYVLSTYMIGDDQSTIPAAEGKLSFSYKCK